MSIARLEINNYKSLKHCCFDLSDINLLIGENGTGKSNILDALQHFYKCLLQEAEDSGCYNFQNKFCNEFSISVTYNFSHLKKISGRNRLKDSDSDYLGYYDWIMRRKQSETLTMRKIKGKAIHWNHDRKYRQNILNLFPLYTVDAREVNLTDWRQLWDIIGDLMKVHRTRESEIAAEISSIKDKEEYKLKERFSKLSDSFDRANIQIKPFTPKQYASTMSTLLFKGNVFAFTDSGLDYESNGTNAFNYTRLLLEILKLISGYKIKDPVVILDEPELSLHHKLIDRMTEDILHCNSAIRFLIATHSPRLLKNILKLEQSNCAVIHVSNVNDTTHITPVSLFSREPADQRPRIFMTDQHANAYFSRYILSVEGASESEVFSNSYLSALFPFLKAVDIMEGMSDDVVQKIISPEQRHFKTRFLLLADMDKAIKWKNADNHFELTGKYLPRTGMPRERYYYSPVRTGQLLRLKRIRALAKQGRFHYWPPFFACTDPNFHEFIGLIKEYLLRQNLYVAATTVEGMLITNHNLSTFWAYCGTLKPFQRVMPDLQAAYDSMLRNDRLNFVRLLFNGKSDYVLTFKEICESNPSIDPALRTLINTNRVEKTSGWISGWLNYYFSEKLKFYTGSDGQAEQFMHAVRTPIHYWLRQDFYRDFPELFEVLRNIKEQLDQ